jgi:hypothetical protein
VLFVGHRTIEDQFSPYQPENPRSKKVAKYGMRDSYMLYKFSCPYFIKYIYSMYYSFMKKKCNPIVLFPVNNTWSSVKYKLIDESYNKEPSKLVDHIPQLLFFVPATFTLLSNYISW